MFWILRTRLTSAAALLNTLNNNHSNSNGYGGNSYAGNNRPARKNYNKLKSGDDNNLDNSYLHHQDVSCKSNGGGGGGGGSNGNCGSGNDIDTTSDSSFTDIELDDRDDFSDDSDYEEALTCNVCDRSFACSKQLSSHKQKKRHFGCSSCDSLFSTLMALEHHKEEFEHCSDDEIYTDEDSDDDDDTVISEECERLL